MSPSPSAEDLYKFIGLTFEQAKSDPKLVEKLSSTEGVLKVVTTEPNGVVIIDIPRMTAVQGSADAESDCTLRMTGEFANRFWQGDLNLLLSVTSGAIGIEGKMATLAKAIPAAKELFPTYIKLLTDAGRADLLV
ncbi:SCP2 sterol-binding domain-containing protein [Rhodococcus tibetensis]|uniref:SCP2 sterol-binding domain-containing protein n=1 Tax=Rhodococcus tibetensis TaxID=2965064 RepID=A0ABT1Q7V1_9NOCA|nr:SCP2 sterol-binding domain-containing protein [Rhodococcus sp. FXJ9.536]MCQ4118325.1 SCP2 sterol-binding domain-containing protein [Rhodococcus sp. FXJ9.536]